MLINRQNSRFLILLTTLCLFLFCASGATAEGFIKKEVYSFKDKNGNVVFTDRQPAKKQNFKTQTIEAANSTGNIQPNLTLQNSNTAKTFQNQPQTIRIVLEQQDSKSQKKYYKKKKSLNRCKTYKKKLTYFSDKMKAGYKNSEYKKLESNRKKYRKLLFNNCDTKTFND